MSTNSEPVEAGHDDADTGAKISGLIDQMREDVRQGNVDDVERVLRERLNDTGIDLGPQEFADIVSHIRA